MKKQYLILLGILGLLTLVLLNKPARKYVMAKLQQLTDAGLKFLQKFEALRLKAYPDEGGKWTIGWGHLIKPGESYYPYGAITDITNDQADSLLAEDTAKAQDIVRRYVTVPLNSNQFDSLVSFAYNVGSNSFLESHLLSKLNAGDYEGAANEFNKWIHVDGNISNGLVARRETEKNLFLTA